MLTIGIIAAFFAWPGWVSILVLSTAMGIMNTSITRIGGQPVSLGFVTGDLNNLGQHLAMGLKRAPVRQTQGPWDTHRLRGALLAGIWTALFMGAVLGAALAALAWPFGPCCCPPSWRLRQHGNGRFAVVPLSKILAETVERPLPCRHSFRGTPCPNTDNHSIRWTRLT
jgi:hypothetical protein